MYGSVVRDARNDWGIRTLRPFTEMWDPDGTRDINFITTYADCPVIHSPWCGIAISFSPTVRFGFWELEERDAADNKDFSKAVFEFTYEDPSRLPSGSTFPEPNNSSSIYLTDLSADPNDGRNWALSTVGVDGAYAIEANTLKGGIEPGVDVGSPGFVPTDPENVPEPLTILGSITALGFGGFFKRKFSKK